MLAPHNNSAILHVPCYICKKLNTPIFMPGLVKKVATYLSIGLLAVTSQAFASGKSTVTDEKKFASLLNDNRNSPEIKKIADSIYDVINLGDVGLKKEIFFKAYKGFEYLKRKGALKKKNLLTICDYSQSSSQKRLYVIDVLNGRLLFNSYVSHGKNSGGEFPESFSNEINSNKSSLGFMVTSGTYNGKAGYSMKFNGMEAGINNNVNARSIVLHGSHFVNEGMLSTRGSMGRSLGCPAVPYGMHKRIIDAIKGGTCFFINHPDESYAKKSKILNARFDLTPMGQTADVQLQYSGDLAATEVMLPPAEEPVQ